MAGRLRGLVSTLEAIRARLRQRLTEKGIDAKALAELTGHNVRTVQGYVATEGRSIPADFIADCELVGFAACRWLLTGTGPADATEPGEAERRLEAVRRALAP